MQMEANNDKFGLKFPQYPVGRETSEVKIWYEESRGRAYRAGLGAMWHTPEKDLSAMSDKELALQMGKCWLHWKPA